MVVLGGWRAGRLVHIGKDGEEGIHVAGRKIGEVEGRASGTVVKAGARVGSYPLVEQFGGW